MSIIKLTAVILAAAACFCVAPQLQAQQNSTATYTSNRFLLFSGSFVVEGTGQTFQGVFKLDTFTGDTWFLQVAMVNNEILRRWVLIKESKKKEKADAIIPSGNVRNQE